MNVIRYEILLWAHPLRKGLRISRGAGLAALVE